MTAEITWTAGASRRIGAYTFYQNKTRVVDDPGVIAAAQTTRGFLVVEKKSQAPSSPATGAPAKPAVKGKAPRIKRKPKV